MSKRFEGRIMNRFENRRKKAQQEMHKKNVVALQVTSRENYFYLTGDIRNVARLFLPQEGEPTIIVFEERSRACQRSNRHLRCQRLAKSR
jgi:Xaa-Pro aminopeptidase